MIFGSRAWVGGFAALTAGLSSCAPIPDLPERVVDPAEIKVAGDMVGFTGVRDMMATDEGLWILDQTEPFVTLLDHDGVVRVRFGQDGAGPGELGNPQALQVRGSGDSARVFVWDVGNGRATVFDRSGQLIWTERMAPIGGRSDIGSVTYATAHRVRDAGGAFVFARYPRGLNHPTDFHFGQLAVAPTAALDAGEPVATLAGSADASPPTGEFAALPLWDACAISQRLIVWRPDSSSIDWLDLHGGTAGSVAVPIPPEALTDQDMEAYLRLMMRLETGSSPEEEGMDVRTMVATRRGLFAREAPVGVELRCGPEGSAWLRLFDTATDPLGRGFSWVVVRPDTPPEVLTFPMGFHPLAFAEDVVFGVQEDPTGLERAAWWTGAADGALPKMSS